MSLLHGYEIFFIYLCLCFLYHHCILYRIYIPNSVVAIVIYFYLFWVVEKFILFLFWNSYLQYYKKQCSCDLYNLFCILMLYSCFVPSFILVHCFEGYWAILGSGHWDIVFFHSRPACVRSRKYSNRSQYRARTEHVLSRNEVLHSYTITKLPNQTKNKNKANKWIDLGIFPDFSKCWGFMADHPPISVNKGKYRTSKLRRPSWKKTLLRPWADR